MEHNYPAAWAVLPSDLQEKLASDPGAFFPREIQRAIASASASTLVVSTVIDPDGERAEVWQLIAPFAVWINNHVADELEAKWQHTEDREERDALVFEVKRRRESV